MGLDEFDRKQKVAISMYPFMCGNIQGRDAEQYLIAKRSSDSSMELILYIHIPFCNSICDFCIYNRVLAEENRIEEYFRALICEIRMYARMDSVRERVVSAIYIGGGTPSAIGERRLRKLIEVCKEEFKVSRDTEITVEVNPSSADKGMILMLGQMEVSRISAGIQTFNDEYRSSLGLKMNRDEVLSWMDMVEECKVGALAIDLMYALPGEGISNWLEDLELATSRSINHLSVYELIIFGNTRLSRRLRMGAGAVCTGKEKFQMFQEAQTFLSKKGFLNQIIPEFHKPQGRSRYWDLAFNSHTETLAMGVSALGFMNRCSYQNESKLDMYISRVMRGELPVESVSREATDDEMAERDIIFSLRKGAICKRNLESKKHLRFYEDYMATISRHMDEGLLMDDGEYYVLSHRGKYFQEDVAVDYMYSTFRNHTSAYRKLVLGTHKLID